MPLMTNPAGGESFTVYVKYNAKAGRWYTREDKQDAEEYEVGNMTGVMDLANVKTGWFLFAAGAAPAKTYDPSLTEMAPKPGDGFKRGFEVMMFSEKNLGGVREFISTAGIVIESINALYDAFLAAPEAQAGKLPVVKCVGVHPVTNKHGTNYQPQLEIVQWTDRPEQMAAPEGDTVKAAPAAAKQPEPVMAGGPPPPTDDDVVF